MLEVEFVYASLQGKRGYVSHLTMHANEVELLVEPMFRLEEDIAKVIE